MEVLDYLQKIEYLNLSSNCRRKCWEQGIRGNQSYDWRKKFWKSKFLREVQRLTYWPNSKGRKILVRKRRYFAQRVVDSMTVRKKTKGRKVRSRRVEVD